MNNWTITGRVGKDAVLRNTKGGDPVLGFSVAVDQRKGGEKVTLWVDCSVWGKRAEALEQYITKGSTVSVTGEAGAREHEGKAYMTLNARDVSLHGGGQKDESRSGGTSARPPRETPRKAQDQASAPAENFDDDEIPFISNRDTW